MHPAKTYELRIQFQDTDGRPASATKEDVINWLIGAGEEAFVEGVVDGIDIPFEYGLDTDERDLFNELGGDAACVSLFKYDREHLFKLRAQIERTFGGGVSCSEHSMDTKGWLEGWKESFKPFATDRFFVYPPWEKSEVPPDTIPLEIEPGMAFGTGQHATTRLCLAELERIASAWQNSGDSLGRRALLDVGTGTGILAIGARKLGFGTVMATDIDVDAVSAAKENARTNGIMLEVLQASVPLEADDSQPKYDLVMANILGVVLRRILKDLALVVKPQGFLVLSGILEEEKPEMIDLGRDFGLKFSASHELSGWSSLRLEKLP